MTFLFEMIASWFSSEDKALCKVCGHFFTPNHGRNTICSDECRRESGRRAMRRYRRKLKQGK
jgi:predicted nucleic acid-binding Zn ribbon protein